ncbi:MAG: ATP-binding protein [Bacteroidetes bacterium]|nr:ATP-binding protein [Fibrella sp.]
MLNRFITKRLLEDLAFFPIVSLVGPRQVGKTTLAQAIRSELATDSLYLDLELTTDFEVLQNAESYLQSHADRFVIIDEVQRKPDLFPLLRALVDQQRRPGRFLLLGSASPDLIRQSSESLAGRIAYLELTPFSLTEVQPQVNWQDHWFRGGFPEALLTSSVTFSGRWMDNFITTFVERDLRTLGYQVAAPTLARFFQILSSVHGNLLNTSDLSRSMGLSNPTVTAYLDLLEGGFLINRLQPYSVNTTKRLVKSPKLYVRDSGMLHRLARIRSFDELQHHVLIGASWEGYVIEQLRRTAPTAEFYFYRTQAGAECDLFVNLPDGKSACIEIKYADVPNLTRGFYSSVEDLKPNHVCVLVPQGRTYTNKNGVMILSLPAFLNDVWPNWTR